MLTSLDSLFFTLHGRSACLTDVWSVLTVGTALKALLRMLRMLSFAAVLALERREAVTSGVINSMEPSSELRLRLPAVLACPAASKLRSAAKGLRSCSSKSSKPNEENLSLPHSSGENSVPSPNLILDVSFTRTSMSCCCTRLPSMPVCTVPIVQLPVEWQATGATALAEATSNAVKMQKSSASGCANIREWMLSQWPC